MKMSDIDATVRETIESRDAFDPDYDRITSAEIVRSSRAHGQDYTVVHAVVMTSVDEIDPDGRVPVETLQVVLHDDTVVSVERLSLHLI